MAKDQLESYTIKVIEALDQRVVIKSPNGEMKMYKIGDKLTESKAKITEILADKLVLEESVKNKSGVMEIQKVIMTKDKNDKTKIERMYVTNSLDQLQSPLNTSTTKMIVKKPVESKDQKENKSN